MRNNPWRIVAIAIPALFLAHLTRLAAADPTAWREEALQRLGVLEKRFISLAEAMPAEKYTWRPGQGVRSVGEVYLHVAAANFGLPRMLGTEPPAGFQMKGYETSTTQKSEIIERLRASFAHLRSAIQKLEDAEQPVKLFGRDSTARAAVWNLLEHLSEHLGQSIAYARINGIVPPWSQSGGM